MLILKQAHECQTNANKTSKLILRNEYTNILNQSILCINYRNLPKAFVKWRAHLPNYKSINVAEQRQDMLLPFICRTPFGDVNLRTFLFQF